MRRFEDAEGRTWDVVVGRESWGNLYALFVPAGGQAGAAVRQALLRSSGYDEAAAELAALDETELRELLSGSSPKEDAE